MAWLSYWLLRLAGWKVTSRLPDIKKYIIIVYPHTSNWDFPIGLFAAWALRMDVTFLGKHTLFVGPFGWLFRSLGGYPVKRDERKNMVSQVVELIESRERISIALAPEGTRKKTDHWKSGFYHIALEAKVPVVLAYIDARRREIGVGPTLEMSGDKELDVQRIRAFYQDKQGIRPELASEICLR
ncbi:MAG: lysophospholipid acyltransferase family protein [Gammaproteobacteria bacterium]|nr:lysophospholipid acyltransferase family protein [Gammaproteobacteria bacterium]